MINLFLLQGCSYILDRIDAFIGVTITGSASNDSFDDGDNTDPKSIKLPIDTESKNTILLNVEGAVKDLVTKLAKKEEVSGVGYDIALEDYTHLPNS